MRALRTAVRVFCVIPFVSGGLDVARGGRFLRFAGAALSDELATDPVLDSQIRFLGAIWIGYGVVLWRAAATLESDRAGFRVLCGVLALGGLGRLGSMARCGSPGIPLTVATAMELAGGVGAAVWHARLCMEADGAS